MRKLDQEAQERRLKETRSWQEQLEKTRFQNQKELTMLHENAATARNAANNAAADKRTDRLADKEAARENLRDKTERQKRFRSLVKEHESAKAEAAQTWDLHKRIAEEWNKNHRVMTVGPAERLVPDRKAGKDRTGNTPENEDSVRAILSNLEARAKRAENIRDQRLKEANQSRNEGGQYNADQLYRELGYY